MNITINEKKETCFKKLKEGDLFYRVKNPSTIFIKMVKGGIAKCNECGHETTEKVYNCMALCVNREIEDDWFTPYKAYYAMDMERVLIVKHELVIEE